MKSLPNLQGSKRSRREIIESIKESVCTQIKLKQIMKVPKDYLIKAPVVKNISPLNTNRSSFLNTSKSIKGPIGNAFTFSQVSRFENTIFEKYKSNYK